MHYNNDNNAYCRVVNAQNCVEHNTLYINTQETHKLYHIMYSHFEIFIYIYSARGEID